MQNLEEGAHRFLDALLVTPFHVRAQADALGDFFIAVGMSEHVVEGFGQVIGDEAVIICQEIAAVLGHLPARQVAGKAIHNRQVKFFGQRDEQIVIG